MPFGCTGLSVSGLGFEARAWQTDTCIGSQRRSSEHLAHFGRKGHKTRDDAWQRQWIVGDALAYGAGQRCVGEAHYAREYKAE